MSEEWPCPVHNCETVWPSEGSLRGHVTGKSDGEHVWSEVKGDVEPRVSGGEGAPESDDGEVTEQGDGSGGDDPPDEGVEAPESEPGSDPKATADGDGESDSNTSKSDMVDPTEYDAQQQSSGGATPSKNDDGIGTGQGDGSGGDDPPDSGGASPPKDRPVDGGAIPGLDALADVSTTTILLGVAVLVVVVWLLTRDPSGGGGEPPEPEPEGAEGDGEAEQSDEVASAFNYDE